MKILCSEAVSMEKDNMQFEKQTLQFCPEQPLDSNFLVLSVVQTHSCSVILEQKIQKLRRPGRGGLG